MRTSLLFLLLIANICFAQKTNTNKKEVAKLPYDSGTLGALSFRMVGPALTSGRVADIAVHPNNKDQWYLAAASGGVHLR